MPVDYEDDDDLDDEEDEEQEEEVVAKKTKKRAVGKKFKVCSDHGSVCRVSTNAAWYSHSAIVSNTQDPNKPKRAMSAFFLYSQAFRSTAKEENPEASFGDIVSHGAAKDSLGRVLGVFASWCVCIRGAA
jgi:hypothetical protein